MRTTIKMLLGISTLLAGLIFWNSASAATYNAYFLKIKNQTNRLIWVTVKKVGTGDVIEYVYVRKGQERSWNIPFGINARFGYDRNVQVTVGVLPGEIQEVAHTGTWMDMRPQGYKKHKFLGTNQPQYLMINAKMTRIKWGDAGYMNIQGEEYTLTVSEGRDKTPEEKEKEKEPDYEYDPDPDDNDYDGDGSSDDDYLENFAMPPSMDTSQY